MSVRKNVQYAYLIGSDAFALPNAEFCELGNDNFEVSDENVAETKFQLEALHAEENALVEMSLLLLVISDSG